MSSSGRKAPVGAAVGLIAAGAGIAAYYYLFLHKQKEVFFFSSRGRSGKSVAKASNLRFHAKCFN